MGLITISPGHYLPGTGASDLIDEVTEARKVVSRVVQLLRVASVGVTHIVDNTSNSTGENLDYLISHHNNSSRKLDVSVHFNSTSGRHDTGIGTEILYLNDKIRTFANKVSKSISNASGLRNRGARKRINLSFLNNTEQPSIIIEVCFVNSTVDVAIYREKFDAICIAIANELIQYVKPGHPLIKEVPHITSQEILDLNEYLDTDEMKSVLDKPILKELFSSTSLVKRLEVILTDIEKVKWIIEKGVSEEAIQNVWLEKLENGSLTTTDLMGLSTLILINGME